MNGNTTLPYSTVERVVRTAFRLIEGSFVARGSERVGEVREYTGRPEASWSGYSITY
jgi:hypothetical protein